MSVFFFPLVPFPSFFPLFSQRCARSLSCTEPFLVDPVRVEPTTVSEGAECRTTCGASCCAPPLEQKPQAVAAPATPAGEGKRAKKSKKRLSASGGSLAALCFRRLILHLLQELVNVERHPCSLRRHRLRRSSSSSTVIAD
jgi:hypothetical protein